MNDKVKKFLIIIVALIPVLFLAWFGIVLYQLDEAEAMNLEIWEVENQILLNEFYSPDSTKRIGFYNYDSGALGYTAIQMSIVDSSQSYPLTGNILMINRIPPSITWETGDSVFVVIDKSNTPGFTIDSSKMITGITFLFKVIATDSTYLKQFEN